jgi:hypothetical protein
LPEVQTGFAAFPQAASDTEAQWYSVGELDGDISSVSSLLQTSQTRLESLMEIMGYFEVSKNRIFTLEETN